MYSPFSVVNGYINLLAREIRLKKDFLSSRQPVCSLRLKGFPLRQFNAEQLTELMFRLCCHFKVQEGERGERAISLSPEQCVSDTLALLKGLSFNNIQLRIDTSIAGPDRSLDPIRRAVHAIQEFSGFRISADIVFSADTSPLFLEKLVAFLSQAQVVEIAFHRNMEGPASPGDHRICTQTFNRIADVAGQYGYRLIGDRCFKKTDHPDFHLRDQGMLSYGPWGFYSTALSEWLALGVAAEGMMGGYLYHNAAEVNDYRGLIEEEKPPVYGWSSKPVDQEEVFDFIQNLYCLHRVGRQFFRHRETLLDSLKVMGWLSESKDDLYLTPEGVSNMATICNLYSRPALEASA